MRARPGSLEGLVSHRQNLRGLGPVEGGGKVGGRLVKETHAFRSQRQKEEGRVEDGRPAWEMGSGASDLSGTGSRSHAVQQRMPSPPKSSRQHRTLCPSLLIPSPGWLGAGSNPGRRNFPAKCFSACIGREAALSP